MHRDVAGLELFQILMKASGWATRLCWLALVTLLPAMHDVLVVAIGVCGFCCLPQAAAEVTPSPARQRRFTSWLALNGICCICMLFGWASIAAPIYIVLITLVQAAPDLSFAAAMHILLLVLLPATLAVIQIECSCECVSVFGEAM